MIDRDAILRVEKKRRRRKQRTAITTIVILLITVLLCSLGYIFKIKYDTKRTVDIHSELKVMLNDSNSSHKNLNLGAYPKDYLPKFMGLYEKNMDVAGWLSIENTKLDLPVVQAGNNEYYDRRDFGGKNNRYGVPFVDYRVDLRNQSTNTIIYGHNMNDGNIFGELLNYKSLEFYKKHPLIKFDSVYNEGIYKIYAIVICRQNDPDFMYHDFVEKADNDEIVEYVTKARERSLINIPVDVKTSDKLLTLSTCDYSFKSETGERIARFVVFARKVRKDEDINVDVNSAKINTSPIMPKEWYDMLRKKQEAEIKAQQEAERKELFTRWLTDDERESLSDEQKQSVATNRKQQAEYYLTFDEITQNDVYDTIYLIERREEQYRKYLTAEERNEPMSVRNSIIGERRYEAKEYLSEKQIEKARNWKELSELIEKAKKGEISKGDEKYAKWLAPHEMQSYNEIQKQQVYEARLKRAEELGVDHTLYDNWNDLSDALDNARLENFDKVDIIVKNPYYLTESDKKKSKAEIERLIESRKKLASDAGITNVYMYKDWYELKAAIDAKADEKAFISENIMYLKKNETNKSYSEIKALVDERKALAKRENIDMSAISSWEQVEPILREKEKSSFIEKNKPYIDKSDEGKSFDELKALVNERKAQTKREGYDSLSTSSWQQTLEFISAKKEEEENNQKQKLIEENLGLLNKDEYTKTVGDLKQLINDRRSICSQNGVEYKLFESWSGTLEEISRVKSEKENKLKEELIAQNRALINEAELTLSLDEIKNIINERRAMATESGITDLSIFNSWDETKAVIDSKNNEKTEDVVQS